MTLEEMHTQLTANTQADFNEILQSSDYTHCDIIELSHKISLANTITDYIVYDMVSGGSDIPTMLYHDKPVSSFCEWYKDKGLNMFCSLEDEISAYISTIRNEVCMVVENPEFYSSEIQNRASYIHSLILEFKESAVDDCFLAGDTEDAWER